jgi:hypothetical protein
VITAPAQRESSDAATARYVSQCVNTG